MDAEALLQNIQFLRQQDARHQIQARLDTLRKAFDTLVGQPQDQQCQVHVAVATSRFEEALLVFHGALSPIQVKALDEIGATEFFHPEFAAAIRRASARNTVTPAFVREQVENAVQRRRAYLQSLDVVEEALTRFGIKPHEIPQGHAEITFSIPHALFQNAFDQLVNELNTVRLIIDCFSEAATGQRERVEVRQISSSDPSYGFGMSARTILAIGKSFGGLLRTWKHVLEIMRVYHDARKIGLPDADLRPILQRIERGLTVQIRVPPLPQGNGSNVDTAVIVDENYDQMVALSGSLEFPPPSAEPVLVVPNREPPVVRHR